MKTALGILLAIALVIIFLQNVCKPPVKDSVSRAKYDSLEQKVKDTAKYYEEIVKNNNAKISDAHLATAEKTEQVEIYQQSLNQAQAVINRLRAKVEGAKLEKPDSSWAWVSPFYIDACDSLTSQVGVLNDKVDEYEEQSAELNKLLHYEIAIRDSALNNERTFNAKFQSQLNNCMTQLQGKVTPKHRAQIYAGIGMLGNKVNPIGGGQVNVSLRARNSQIYEVTGAMIGNTWYGGVGTKILISFGK